MQFIQLKIVCELLVRMRVCMHYVQRARWDMTTMMTKEMIIDLYKVIIYTRKHLLYRFIYTAFFLLTSLAANDPVTINNDDLTMIILTLVYLFYFLNNVHTCRMMMMMMI